MRMSWFPATISTPSLTFLMKVRWWWTPQTWRTTPSLHHVRGHSAARVHLICSFSAIWFCALHPCRTLHGTSHQAVVRLHLVQVIFLLHSLHHLEKLRGPRPCRWCTGWHTCNLEFWWCDISSITGSDSLLASQPRRWHTLGRQPVWTSPCCRRAPRTSLWHWRCRRAPWRRRTATNPWRWRTATHTCCYRQAACP